MSCQHGRYWTECVQEELQPILLRRMKEDVESLPEKEEVLVWVELTHQQRSYYRALYANQVDNQKKAS